ncbi:mCG146282, partial [Mus musculus]
LLTSVLIVASPQPSQMMELCSSNSKLAPTGQTNLLVPADPAHVFLLSVSHMAFTFSMFSFSWSKHRLKNSWASFCSLPENVSATVEMDFFTLVSNSPLISTSRMSFKTRSWLKGMIRSS